MGQCSCGESHELDVKEIVIEEGAISKVNPFLIKMGIGDAPVLICDKNTYHAAGKALYSTLTGHKKSMIVLQADKIDADEKAVQSVIEELETGITGLIAVGAGTIHDVTRYVAKQYNLPFVSVPTAASVDGFVSTVAAMTMNGFKITYPAVSPIAVFADTHIFSKAPYRLTAAGVADLLGKYTALLDWEISHLLTGEYICPKVVAMEKEAVQQVVDTATEIRKGSKEAYEGLMYGLLLSGLAMQMIGNSRPASGAEHHMSHLWEMHVINPQVDALHGEKVGVALGIVCDHYKKVMEIGNAQELVPLYKGFPSEELKEVFKDLYPSIIEENIPDLLEEIDSQILIERFYGIKELIEDLPTGDNIRDILTQAGAKIGLADIGLSPEILEKSIVYSPFVRRRLTLMRILKLIQ